MPGEQAGSRSAAFPWARQRGEEGSSTVLLFAVILFLSAAALGAMALLGSSARLVERRVSSFDTRKALEEAARGVIAQLGSDPSPDADSTFDPVWGWLAGQKSESGASLMLEDVSSEIDLNLVRTELFDKTDLGRFFAAPHTSGELRQLRADKGPFPTLASYAPFFQPDSVARDFTVYGYVNVNTTFEDVLRQIYAARTGDEGAADVFRAEIQGYLMRQELITPDELPALLGIYYRQLYPLMNAEPAMNVNFVPKEVLHAVLSYPYGGKPIANIEGIYATILADREGRELTADYLARLIPVQGEQRLILAYLGARTWFWRITAASPHGRVVLVVARIPGGNPVRFAVLEDHFVS